MADLLNQLLVHQYEAALCTLRHCVTECPESAWQEPVANMTFDQVAFHTLFFTDVYLCSHPDQLKQQPYHQQNETLFRDYEEMEPRVQIQHYEKEVILHYLDFCHAKVNETLANESAADLAAACQFPRKSFSRAELHVYNVRHIQHHAAQLILRLRLDHQIDTPWFSSGWRD